MLELSRHELLLIVLRCFLSVNYLDGGQLYHGPLGQTVYLLHLLNTVTDLIVARQQKVYSKAFSDYV